MTHYENIPDEIRKLEQWVCARSESKMPMCAFTNAAASSTDSRTWSTFDTALSAVSKGHYDYCGFTFNNNGLVGIDIDDGYDEDGFISPLAATIIDTCASYTEKSKSGSGFHILVRGTLPFSGKNNLSGVEIYQTARYFIMTGDVIAYDTIISNQAAIDYIVATYFPTNRQSNCQLSRNDRIYSPVWELPTANRIKLRPVYPRIPDGSRNICLTSLAGMLHNIGYTKLHIYEELSYCNKVACDPPLDNREIQMICNSVTRYTR